MIRLKVFIIFITLFMLAALSLAGDDLSNPSLPLADTGPSVSKFLTSDGRFDLEAMRTSGYQGALDMEGFQASIDPITGQPIFQPLGTQELADDPDDIYWDNSISPCFPGVR